MLTYWATIATVIPVLGLAITAELRMIGDVWMKFGWINRLLTSITHILFYFSAIAVEAISLSRLREGNEGDGIAAVWASGTCVLGISLLFQPPLMELLIRSTLSLRVRAITRHWKMRRQLKRDSKTTVKQVEDLLRRAESKIEVLEANQDTFAGFKERSSRSVSVLRDELGRLDLTDDQKRSVIARLGFANLLAIVYESQDRENRQLLEDVKQQTLELKQMAEDISAVEVMKRFDEMRKSEFLSSERDAQDFAFAVGGLFSLE